MNKSVINSLEKRKTVFQLNKDLPMSSDGIIDLIKTTIYNLPSAFNSQSTRVAILLGEEHSKHWEIVENAEKKVRTAEEFAYLKNRLDWFYKAYGTVLFFEDQNVITDISEDFNVGIEKVQQWSHEHQGAATVAVWTSLADNKIGANLQHYVHYIRQEVWEAWDIPKHWQLYAQLVFGGIKEPGVDKDKVDIEKRVKVFGG